MNVKRFDAEYSDDDTGTLTVAIEADGDTYDVAFDFCLGREPPVDATHTPIPDAKPVMYAWPRNDVPDDVLLEPKLGAGMVIDAQLPAGIVFLNAPYDEVDEYRSPFIDWERADRRIE